MACELSSAYAISSSQMILKSIPVRGFVRAMAATFLLLLAVCAAAQVPAPSRAELERWQLHAEAVTITRDDWGIAHVRGRTDADAVFGMIYAQAEDDFNRVETNYLTALGRLAEAEGESAIWQDLRAAAVHRSGGSAGPLIAASPDWLQRLMNAWADGLNFYLAHPSRRCGHASSPGSSRGWRCRFTEGSIGGDIERIELARARGLLRPAAAAAARAAPAAPTREPRGSNGIAIAPAPTRRTATRCC